MVVVDPWDLERRSVSAASAASAASFTSWCGAVSHCPIKRPWSRISYPPWTSP